MILPKGEIVYKNLKTFFIDIDKFLFSLKRDEFTGQVHFIFPNAECVIFLMEGDVVSGAEEIKGERYSGQKAVKEILALARKNPNGYITVYKLPPETVNLLTKVFSHPVKLIYKNLSAEFSHLGMLIAKLKDEKFTGYIEVQFPQDKKQGIILLEKGLIKAILSEESKIGVKEEMHIELRPTNLRIVEEAQRKGAIFNVFRIQPE